MKKQPVNIASLPTERWRDYDDYLVSDHGRIYTFKSKLKYNPAPGRLLKASRASTGYLKQCLNGQSHSIHRIVAGLYVPNPLNLPEVHHIDHNKENNHYKNLKWVTHQQNIQLSYSEGNHITPRGSAHWNFGKKVKQVTKQKQSLAKIGEKHPKFKGYYMWQGQRFTSCQALADQIGTYVMKVNRMVKKGIVTIETNEKTKQTGD